MGIQFCSNEGSRPVPNGDNIETAKYIDEFKKKILMKLKIVLCRTAGPISSKFGTKHPWVMGI